MNKLSYILFFVVLAACLTSASQYIFKANCNVRFKNFAGAGSLPGTVSFHYDDTNSGRKSLIRYQFTVIGANGKTSTISEYENFTVSKTYKVCSNTCEGGPLARAAEPWWWKSGDTAVNGDVFVGDDGVSYLRYNRNPDRASGITALYLANKASGAVPTSPNQIAAKILFNDGHEVIVKKSGLTVLSSKDSSFNMPTNVVCETKTCKSYLDVVFVLDESGSISSRDFTTMKTFVRSLVGNLTLGPDAANIGVIMFSSSSRTIFSLKYNNIDTDVQNIGQRGGTTYQGYGLRDAYNMLTKSWRIPVYGKPTQFVIALTDGADFDYGVIRTYANQLKNFGVILIEVGIGIGSYYANQLKDVASNLNGVPGYFDVANFNGLLEKINDLVVPICEKGNSSACDAKCFGYCGCQMSCYCPTCDPSGSTCFDNKCVVVGNTTAGCVNETNNPSTDKCLDFTCPAGSWVGTRHDCSPTRKYCEEDACDSKTGCKPTVKVHTKCQRAPDKCHTATCNPSSGSADSQGCVYVNTCTGPSDSDIKYSNGRYGCINYTCKDGRCISEDLCQVSTANSITACMPLQCNTATHQCEISGGDVECTSDANCQKKDDCSTPKCDGTTHKCVNTPIHPLPGCNGCYKVKCNSKTKTYELYYKGCGNLDKCMKEECTNSTGKCTYEPVYKYQPCYDVECDKVTGAGRGNVPRDCSRPDVENGTCIRFRCNVDTDSCESYILDAVQACPNDNPLCVSVSCSERGALCVYTEKEAPDATVCRPSRCDPKTGNATLYDKCDDGRVCTIDSCDFEGGCTHIPNFCTHMPTANMSSCFSWSCSESRKNGCYRKIYENSRFDECGNCIGPNDDLHNVTDSEASECKKALTWEEKAAAISAGVIGGVIAACVIGALGVSVGGTLLTRELIRRARAAADSGAVENPMYQDNGREMSNPAFEGEDMDS